MTHHCIPKQIPTQAIQFDGDNSNEVLKFIGDSIVACDFCVTDKTLKCTFKQNWSCTIKPTDWLVTLGNDVVVFDDEGFRHYYTLVAGPL